MFLTFTTDLGQKTKGRTKWVECTHGTLGRESVGCERNTDHWTSVVFAMCLFGECCGPSLDTGH